MWPRHSEPDYESSVGENANMTGSVPTDFTIGEECAIFKLLAFVAA
jgi:hypothetical protein